MRLERELSYYEKFFYERRINDFYSNFFVSATYCNKTGKDFKKLLIHAVKNLILKYPALYTNVHQDSDNLDIYFKPVDSINLKNLIDFENYENLLDSDKNLNESIVYDIVKFKFDYGQANLPLWKLKIINDYTVIFYCDHLLFDGTSGSNFHMKLLEELNLISFQADAEYDVDNNDFDIVLFNSRIEKNYLKPIPKSIYDHFYLENSESVYTRLVPAWLQEIFQKSFEYFSIGSTNINGQDFIKAPFIDPKYLTKPGDFEYDIKIINIPVKVLKLVLKSTREKNVSLTSLIIYISLLALAPLTNEKTITAKIPVDLRERLDLSDLSDEINEFDDTFGLFIKLLQLTFPPAKLKFKLNNISNERNAKFNWNEIKKINSSLSQSASQDHFKTITKFKHVDIKENMLQFANKPFISTLQISNLGLIKSKTIDENNSNVIITDMLFSQSNGVLGSPFFLNIISTAIGGMNIVLSTIPDLKSEYAESVELLEKIILEIEHYL
ncbi:hypothetical protein PACTADRAFT_31304 [Pachysolen tannophilus NRRL Y-2460]|uniref:Alcohol acetyltransferase n=1 Tax=Pachysolen tannophilus NRRL Y-2460 TaxID=669874 RepID=A0A1E4U1J9_PACTA|nr:hypothetical protein PACTADRAFT_31304 [Pachysolen tannophilus NRRL Y-2460]